MTDPDFQPAIDDAINELARRLAPWAVAMADPEAFARRFFDEWMLPRRWRTIPGPPPVTGRRTDPPPEYLAARAALTREDTDPHA